MPLAGLGIAALPTVARTAAVEPLGELKKRIEMARGRMLDGEAPAFTKDFVLADVALRPDYARRFSNYSGDLSGRYIGAFASMPAEGAKPHLCEVVHDLIRYQKPDGRFGRLGLTYAPEEISADHMALLWGNGRLLVGLMEYHALEPDEAVLGASKRLGDFIVTVHEGCADERVAEKVKGLGAAGVICFSQLVEPLVLLASATGDKVYLEGAERIVPWFPKERGKQHSHGYLTTLRGIVMLYEATGETEYLDMVEGLYAALVDSADCTVYGGVQEYFGGKGDRDEGCSEADFVRLSLQLWRVTGKLDYLERGERCLLNQFYANQFCTGDFGHHLHFKHGIAPHQGVGRAWWCCTMHGLRAFRDVLDSIVTTHDGAVRINLFLDVLWSDATRSIALEQGAITVKKAPDEGMRVAVRRPAWAEEVKVTLNGNAIETSEEDGYLILDNPLHTGDRAEISFDLERRIVKRNGTALSLDQLSDKPVEGALYCGPWLLGVDEADNPQFFGEPWVENQVLLPPQAKGGAASTDPLVVPAAHMSCQYVHDGFPGKHPLALRPISERTTHGPVTFAAWLKCRRTQ